jgi:glycosyltransferase involved in cell wall biosynthesis
MKLHLPRRRAPQMKGGANMVTWQFFSARCGHLRMGISRIAQRIGASRYPPAVPKLTLSPNPVPASPTAWFICPDYNPPSGGIRKLYRCVDILNNAGLSAAILHARPGFRCSWFENTTRVVSAAEVTLGPRDILVVPEIYGQAICDLPRNIRKVIFNQNAYNTLKLLTNGSQTSTPYTDNPDLALVLVVSQDNAEVIKHIFPGTRVRRLHLGIDPLLYHPPHGPKQRRIAYMPRKRPGDAASVLALLKLRGALDGWDVVAIEGRSEVETAHLLQTAKLFLSFSPQEGFGLPPLEALACGCLVVGYHGFGGREYFHPPFATAVEDGDIAGFARAVEATIHKIDNDPRSAEAIMASAAGFVSDGYPLETEKQDLLDVFGPLLNL